MSVENVNAILDSYPAWIGGSGKIDTKYTEQYLAAGHSDQAAADCIIAFAMAYPYEDPVDCVWWSFGGGSENYYVLNTAQALGLQPLDSPVPSRPPVYRSEDAVKYAKEGWRFDGKSQFIDMSQPDRVAEFDRRSAFAAVLPPSWYGVDPLIYWYLVVEGTVDSQPPDLGTRPDTNAKNWYGFTFQQFLDNQWAILEHKPAPWKKGGQPA